MAAISQGSVRPGDRERYASSTPWYNFKIKEPAHQCVTSSYLMSATIRQSLIDSIKIYPHTALEYGLIEMILSPDFFGKTRFVELFLMAHSLLHVSRLNTSLVIEHI